MKVNMLDIQCSKVIHLADLARQNAEFLVKNQALVSISDMADISSIQNIKIVTSNPISDLGRRILDLKLLNDIFIYDVTNIKSGIPQLAALTDITVDGKLLGSDTPSFLQKAWFNLTPIARRRAVGTPILITDIPTYCATLVRAMLCMSYDDSTTWLTPRLTSFIIESYSMTISSLLKRIYFLDIEDQNVIHVLVGAMMAQWMSAETLDNEYPPLLMRCNFANSLTQADIKKILDRFKDKREELDNNFQLSWPVIQTLFTQVGPESLNEFSVAVLRRMFSGSPVDSWPLVCAFDYPPYWVTEVFKCASGTKIPHIISILKQSYFKRGVVEFTNEMLKAESFLGSINR